MSENVKTVSSFLQISLQVLLLHLRANSEAATGVVFYEKVFVKLAGKQLCQDLFFNKIAGLFFNKVAGHSCFPMNFAKFLRAPFFQNTSGRLHQQILKF